MRLNQIYLNLLTNAVKYTDKGWKDPAEASGEKDNRPDICGCTGYVWMLEKRKCIICPKTGYRYGAGEFVSGREALEYFISSCKQ